MTSGPEGGFLPLQPFSHAAMSIMHPEVRAVAKLLDHAVLHPTAGPRDTLAGCDLARKYQIAALCVKPCFTSLARSALEGSGVAVCAVTGFPHGNSAAEVKVFETEKAIADGASEIDTVINNGLVAGGLWDEVESEIRALQAACARGGALLKVILETDYLRPDQARRVCEICLAAGAGFVKTSTGFGFVKQPGGGLNYTGATEEMVRLMVEAAGGRMGVKASGGIRTLDQVLRFRDLGCARIGVGASESILKEAEARWAGSAPSGPGSGADGY